MKMVPDKIHPSSLGFDFDGVIADTAEAFIRLCARDYGHAVRLEDITDFQVERCLDLDPGIVEEVFTRILLDSVGTGLRPMDGAVEVLAELTASGPVTMITARSDPGPVREWLAMEMPETVGRNLVVVAMGAHDDKARYVREHGLECFVDDRAGTCLQLAEAGIEPIVYSQPWNRGRHPFRAVNTWQDIRALCI